VDVVIDLDFGIVLEEKFGLGVFWFGHELYCTEMEAGKQGGKESGRKSKTKCLNAETQRRGEKTEEKQRRSPYENKTGRQLWRPVDNYDNEIGLAFFAARGWFLAGALFFWSRFLFG